MSQQLGLNDSGLNGYNPDIVAGYLFTQGFTEPMNTKFGGAISHMRGKTFDTGYRTDIENGAAFTLTHSADHRMYTVKQLLSD